MLIALNAFPGSKPFSSDIPFQPLSAKTGVEWRTEITQADEAETWPFKEASYMLGCLGVNGKYMVYLVKTEDIMFKADRPENFVPRYYALKGTMKDWHKADTQLRVGQTAAVFSRYIDKSLDLCKKAEAAKHDPKAVRVDKK